MTKAIYVAKGETDSEEAGCYLVDNKFSKEAFEEITGWFAITAIDKKAERLIIGVDFTTPFHVAFLGEGLIWSSTKDALASTLRAFGIKNEIVEVSSKILEFPARTTVSISRSYTYSSNYSQAYSSKKWDSRTGMPTSIGPAHTEPVSAEKPPVIVSDSKGQVYMIGGEVISEKERIALINQDLD